MFSPVTNALLESAKGENDPQNDFMVYLHESCLADLGFELAIPGSAVRRAVSCTVEPCPISGKWNALLYTEIQEIIL